MKTDITVTVEELQAGFQVYQVPKENLSVILPPDYFLLEEVESDHSCFLCKGEWVLAIFEMEIGDTNPEIARLIQRIAWWHLYQGLLN